MKVQINRRGFRNAPAWADNAATDAIGAYLVEFPTIERILAVLRPATYCGEDSPGAHGAYVLDLTWQDANGSYHDLMTIPR